MIVIYIKSILLMANVRIKRAQWICALLFLFTVTNISAQQHDRIDELKVTIQELWSTQRYADMVAPALELQLLAQTRNDTAAEFLSLNKLGSAFSSLNLHEESNKLLNPQLI